MAIRAERSRGGALIPVMGLGTWRMGERPERRAGEVAALRLGLDLGMSLVDTAEMYADGAAERVVAEAVAGRRDEVFLVSKVLPQNASREGTLRAAERSLARLETDRIDLYLLHWRGRHPLEDTLAAFEILAEQGKIRHYGVSNFDSGDIDECEALTGGSRVAANQVLYNLQRRGVERGLLRRCRALGVTVMAYTPLEPAGAAAREGLRAVDRRHGCSTQRVALAWTLRDPGVVTLPKAARPEHVRDNVAALDLTLTEEDLAELDRAYPMPVTDGPLETI